MRHLPQLCLLLASLATVAAAQPPWSAEAPGAADSRFGLGLEAFFERQESLKIESALSTVTLRAPGGQESRTTVPGDPALLNRKFDILWEIEGVGVDFPIALPTLGLPGSARLYSTLSLQASTVDVSLDFLDRSQAQDSTSLDGRGELFGAGLDLAANLCRNCPWYAVGGYRFQKIPWMSVDRSPLFTLAGAEVLHDEVRLSRQTQDLSLGMGYVSPSSRFASYVGARRRWTDLDVDDELRFVDRERQETSLESRTQLGSEVVLAYAGVDTHLWGSVYGQAEAMYSQDDWGALLRVVYLWPSGPRIPIRPQPLTEAEEAELEQRATEVAGAVALALKEVEAEFLAGWRRLDVVAGLGGRPAYRTREVRNLLTTTENRLHKVLGDYPELEAMQDWVTDEFRKVYSDLESMTFILQAAWQRAPQNTVAFAVSVPGQSGASGIQRVQSEPVSDQKSTDTSILGRVLNWIIGTPKKKAEGNQFLVRLTFRTELKRVTGLLIYPRYDRSPSRTKFLASGTTASIWPGSYSFEIRYLGNRRIPYCDANRYSKRVYDPGPNPDCPLDLASNPCAVLYCDENGCMCRANPG